MRDLLDELDDDLTPEPVKKFEGPAITPNLSFDLPKPRQPKPPVEVNSEIRYTKIDTDSYDGMAKGMNHTQFTEDEFPNFGFTVDPDLVEQPEPTLFNEVLPEEKPKKKATTKAPSTKKTEKPVIKSPMQTYIEQREAVMKPAEETAESDVDLYFDVAHDDVKERLEEQVLSMALNPANSEQKKMLGNFEVRQKPKIWVGVDPGKDGGIVAISEQGIVMKAVVPLIGKDVDPLGIFEIFQELINYYDVCVVIEDVHSLFGMAADTNFSMGHTLGILQGVIVACSLRMIKVAPKTWQKEIWQNSEIEFLPMKPDQKRPSINTKLTSMKAAHRLYPKADFRKSARATKAHDGICDATCIAEYGRRKNL